MISVKTQIRKSSIFGENPWTNQFFSLKMIVFYLKYRKTIFSDIISDKNSDKREFDFSTKSMD